MRLKGPHLPTCRAPYVCLGYQNLKEFFDINYKPAFEALFKKKERKKEKPPYAHCVLIGTVPPTGFSFLLILPPFPGCHKHRVCVFSGQFHAGNTLFWAILNVTP